MSRESSPERLVAERYWRERLAGETLIKTPMDPRCEIGIVVPVYREDISRLEKQIASLQRQKKIPLEALEVMYVVNNNVANGSGRSRADIEANARAMAFLRGQRALRIHVVDKSSRGNEIPGCNVGKARNRGLAEMTYRFHGLGKNGIVLQTDADTWLEDEVHLFRLKTYMDTNPAVIGLAGGVIFSWSPDAKDPSERALLLKKQKKLTLRKTYDRMSEYIRLHGNLPVKREVAFCGAHMVSRSEESAQIGGLPDLDAYEDRQFGVDLSTFAERHGKRVVGAKDEFQLITAIRESDRTTASFGSFFNSVEADRFELVPDVLEGDGLVELDEAYAARLKNRVREIEGGDAFVAVWDKNIAKIRLEEAA